MNSDRPKSSYDAALAFLFGRIDYERLSGVTYGEREYKLDRMRELLARLGNPHLGRPTVHVAGTKGKGSTAAMTAAVLSAAGYRTGLYSSPHLELIEERMVIDGELCSSEEFASLVDVLRPIVQEMDEAAARASPPELGPTYFELTTALAMLHFARSNVDAVVLEVGMGGRLDSTNVCQPLVSIITSISFDHTKQLGNTLAAIAREKAGIIKPGVPVVSGVLNDEPRRVIEEVSRANGSRLLELGRDFDYAYHPAREVDAVLSCPSFDFMPSSPDCGRPLADVRLGLLGRHQAANASLAMTALAELGRHGFQIGEEAIRSGFARMRWPAHVELVGRRPAVLVDAAHNLASIAALLDTLAESFHGRRRILVFGTTKEKDVRGMLELLLPQFDRVILTRYLNNPRAVPPEELQAIASQIGGRSCSVAADPATAWDEVRAVAEPADLVCITGSFFIATEMRQQIDDKPLGAGHERYSGTCSTASRL